jgi:acetylornithine deacetylase/succinyl-diaminopimelate desuccinylase-like protein
MLPEGVVLLSPREKATAERVRGHVESLAGKIGERNVFRPTALAAAREYIEAEWRQQGYQVSHQWYHARGHRCANVEVTRTGSDRPEQILLVGAHYDTVRSSPSADDNAAASPHSSNYPAGS